MGSAAAMGPVNMLAIHRGLIGGWRHTLACGVGFVTGKFIIFSLVLLGGHYLFSDLSNPTLQSVLAAISVIVLLPLGIYFFVRAVKGPPAGLTPAIAKSGMKARSPRIWPPMSPPVLP